MNNIFFRHSGRSLFGWHTFIMVIVGLACFTSCTTIRQSQYFTTLQKDTTISGLVSKEMDTKIRTGDNMGINISSLSAEEDNLFNKGVQTGKQEAGITAQGFLVGEDGKIYLHKIGMLQAAGLTRKELGRNIQELLQPYLKDPLVTVQFLNHKITVMGSVSSPKVINMPTEQITLIDALVLSGDLGDNGRKDNILIIREEGNERKVKKVNMEDHAIFSSPWYYLQPNDIVVVAHNYDKVIREEKQRRFQMSLSFIVSGISLFIIILDRLTR